MVSAPLSTCGRCEPLQRTNARRSDVTTQAFVRYFCGTTACIGWNSVFIRPAWMAGSSWIRVQPPLVVNHLAHVMLWTRRSQPHQLTKAPLSCESSNRKNTLHSPAISRSALLPRPVALAAQRVRRCSCAGRSHDVAYVRPRPSPSVPVHPRPSPSRIVRLLPVPVRTPPSPSSPFRTGFTHHEPFAPALGQRHRDSAPYKK